MDEDPARNAVAAALGERLYGSAPRVRKLHSENNYVCALEFADGRRKVLKVAGAPHLETAVRQEAVALARLAAAGLQVPRLEFASDELPNATEVFFTMDFVTDSDLSEGIRKRESWALAACERAGAFVRQLHRLPAGAVDGLVPQHAPITTSISWEHWTLREAWGLAEPGFRAHLEPVRQRINQQLSEPPTVVVHDSLIANHVLTDGAGAFAVNDWETIRLGYAERDLACFLAGLRTWTDGLPEHDSAFLDGYAGGTLDSETAQRVAAWRVYYIMNWTAFYIRQGRAASAEWLLSLARAAAYEATTGA